MRNFFRKLFGRAKPLDSAFHHRRQILPRVVPAQNIWSFYHVKEYVRGIHLQCAYWKKRDRSSPEYVMARAEARLVQWVYYAVSHEVSEEGLCDRVATYAKGWPYYPKTMWEDGARHLYRSLGGAVV